MLVLFIVVALFAMKVIPSFMEYRTTKSRDRGDRAPGRDQPGATCGARSRTARRSTTSSPCGRRTWRSRKRRQLGGDRVRLPQGNPAVHRRRPVHRLRRRIRGAAGRAARPRVRRRESPRAGADAPQPRCGPQRAAGIPRRRRPRLRGRRRALRPLPAASRRQADPAARKPGARGVPRPGGARARPGGSGARRARRRSPPSVLADALEAVFGAVFLDGGYAAARRAVVQALGAQLEQLDPARVEKDAKTAPAGAAARAAASPCPSTAWWPPMVRPTSAPSTSNARWATSSAPAAAPRASAPSRRRPRPCSINCQA